MDDVLDGSLMGLNIGYSIDKVPFHKRPESLINACKKIAYGGVIEMVGTDLPDLTRAYFHGYITSKDTNEILFADGNISAASLEEMVELLSSNGFTLLHQRRNRYIYYIKAKRNQP
jgi:hypothetical protein